MRVKRHGIRHRRCRPVRVVLARLEVLAHDPVDLDQRRLEGEVDVGRVVSCGRGGRGTDGRARDPRAAGPPQGPIGCASGGTAAGVAGWARLDAPPARGLSGGPQAGAFGCGGAGRQGMGDSAAAPEVSMKARLLSSAKSLASSTSTACMCFKSHLLPTSIATIDESAYVRSSCAGAARAGQP